MKKIFGIFLVLSIVLAATFTTSCFLADDDDENVYPAPKVLKGTKSITISSNAPKGTETVNIIRISCENEAFREDVREMNIGQAVSGKNTDFSASIAFFDEYTNPGTFYKYAVRFFDGHKMTTSAFSEVIEGNGTAEANLATSASGEEKKIKFIRNDKTSTYALRLLVDIDVPVGFSELALVLNNGTISRPFQVATGDSETGFTVAADTPTEKSLVELLGNSFMDKNLSVIGFIGITNLQELGNTYTYYYWTNLLKVKDSAVELEWYNSEGKNISDEAKAINVPSPDKSENPLLYSVKS